MTSTEQDIVERLRENVAEQLNESAGYWHSCSGCHESIDGHSVTPTDPIFRCAPGGGCRECGGIGVVWDNIDYDDLVKFHIEEDRKDAEITKLRAERDAAATILAGCATQYPYASGLTVTDDPHEGYGPLKEARLFIERHGCAADHAELNKWPRYRGAAALVATEGTSHD